MIFPKDTFLYADRRYSKGDVIMDLGKKPCNELNSSRIQVDEDTFILPPKLLAHCCSPNSFIEWKTMKLKALHSIDNGSLITYHYGTSEYDYRIGSFLCECGSDNCVGEFKGFLFLSKKDKDHIKNFLSPYINQKYISKI